MIEQIEHALVERLKKRLPGRVSKIDIFPDSPGDYDFPSADQAAAFVRFAGSDFTTDDTPRNTYAPRETVKFQVVILTRALRRSDSGPVSAYQVIKETRLALHGRSFCGSTPFKPVRVWLDEENSGVWRWSMEFATSIPCIADVPDDPDPME